MAIGTPVYLGGATTASAGDTCEITTVATVPAGALIIVCVLAKSQSAYGTWTVSGGGLTWQKDGRWQQTSSSFGQAEFHSAPAPSGLASSSTIAIVNDGSNTNWGEIAQAFYCEGLDTGASRFDGSATLTAGDLADGGETTWTISENYDTANDDDLLVVPAFTDGSNDNATLFDSPTVFLADVWDAANSWDMAIGYRILTSAGAYLPTGTISGGAAFGYVASAGAYKEATEVGTVGGAGGMARPGRERGRAPRREGAWW